MRTTSNPVKHGYVAEPRLWPYSSFSRWVVGGVYAQIEVCQGAEAALMG